ncbi:hypothetical protein PIB30_084783 [Stylosanthes scabra]|uniref:Fructose-bisphosphate aldolase n=1 Tax=Stylosanthes scabra TaxID=79078 RepID=A0ABU6RT83_9FABA|nr:hypothetical protein [Stylosanthes scabra]
MSSRVDFHQDPSNISDWVMRIAVLKQVLRIAVLTKTKLIIECGRDETTIPTLYQKHCASGMKSQSLPGTAKEDYQQQHWAMAISIATAVKRELCGNLAAIYANCR